MVYLFSRNFIPSCHQHALEVTYLYLVTVFAKDGIMAKIEGFDSQLIDAEKFSFNKHSEVGPRLSILKIRE